MEGVPAEGQYRWKRSGTQTVATLPNVKLPVSGFEQRLVRNVVKVSETEYTFETVQPELGTNITTISTFKVKIGAVSKTVTPPVQPPDLTRPTSPVPLPITPPGPPADAAEAADARQRLGRRPRAGHLAREAAAGRRRPATPAS